MTFLEALREDVPERVDDVVGGGVARHEDLLARAARHHLHRDLPVDLVDLVVGPARTQENSTFSHSCWLLGYRCKTWIKGKINTIEK